MYSHASRTVMRPYVLAFILSSMLSTFAANFVLMAAVARSLSRWIWSILLLICACCISRCLMSSAARRPSPALPLYTDMCAAVRCAGAAK